MYTENVVITDPDITAIVEPYTIPVSTSDLYRCFVLSINNTTDHFIKRLEVIPGNRAVVHHVLVFRIPAAKSTSSRCCGSRCRLHQLRWNRCGGSATCWDLGAGFRCTQYTHWNGDQIACRSGPRDPSALPCW
ncbi:MAG: hypothetical protein IPP33_19395 [Flavobacteriales bacterium]|nr:hypothetical protein [Flavobacteriales bacterium]